MNTITLKAKQKLIATILFCICMLSISITSSAQIFQPEGLNMPGAYNGFTNPPSNLKFANASQTAGGQLNINSSLAGQVIWQTKFSAAISGGDIVGGNYDFLFTSGPSGNYYANKWGGVASWTLNTPNNVYIGGSQPNDNCTFTNGKFYTVNWLDLGYNDTKACIMETGASPATISTVSNSSPCAGTSTLVSFTLSVTPSAQEIFYVRWSNNNFVSSSLVTAATVGANGSASIPGQIAATTVKYYVFSSTVSSGNIGTDYDLCTINLNGNGGLNFSYTVPTISITETHINPSCAVPNSGSIDITVTGGTPIPATQIVTQNFNTLALSGTSSTLPSGWLLSESGSNANTIYTAGTGSGTAGDTYSFGSASNSDRAFGGLQSGSLIPTIGAVFTNTTGSTVTSISISYTGEQWRLGATARVDRMDFQYSTNATSLTTGTWSDFDALDFTAPVTTGTVGALDGNAAANKTSKSGTISSLSIANGATLYIRWNDFNATGSDDGLSVDDFTATLISSGPGTYNFAWSNGATTEDISSIIANTYTVTVTDANTCTATKSITINPATGINLIETHTNVSCNGGSNGSIDLTATGGTGIYTYFWSNGFILQDISSLTAGTYTVTVSDGSCTSNLSVILTAPPAIVISETHNNISCNAATDGSIDLTVSGGAGGFLYSWSNSATSQDLSGLAAGTYSVTVTDAGGCQNFISITVTEPTVILLSETHANVSCFGGNSGSINLNVSGGTPSTTIPYTQNFNTLALSGTGNAWVDNSTISNWYASRTTYNADIGSSTTGALYSYGSASNSERALGSLASGGTGTINYGVKIINTTGETVSSITVGYWGEQWRCGGNINQQKLDFGYQINATSITSGTWTDVNDLDFYSQINNASASALDGNVEPNKFYVYGVFNVTLAAGDAIWLRYTDINDTGNDHGLGVDDLSVQLTTASGGYTYAWSNGITTQDVSSLASNTYSVTVTDSKNCSATTSVSITEPDAISISGTQFDATCSNVNDGSIDVSVSGGTPFYFFLWSNGETTEDITALLPGDYTITVTDFNNCSSSLSFTIGSDQTATTWYADADNDTYGDENDVIISCDQPAGYIANAGDCNDGDEFIYTEQTYYGDVDGDSFGDVGNTFSVCSYTPPSGYVTDATDCDDANYMYNDADNDGYGAGDPVACGVTNNTDCNDGDENINPDATEICNGIDDDCANGIDDGLTFVTYYVDADGDGYGDVNDAGISSCANPGAGYSSDNTDCNDAVNAIHPNQIDLCNTFDDDCDGSIDEDATFINYYVDADGDGYGDVNDAGIS
ncbi:MAG: hypothetical protein LH473_09435, partial [Chitinophagales bacterium]|nr:hypothetical protein [Chitinophagales bacterium]